MNIKSDTEFFNIVFKCYDNPIVTSVDEFDTDIRRFQYLNTILNRYRHDGELSRLRIAANHVVIIANCFGVKNTPKLIRYKIDEKNLLWVDTILYFLNYIELVESGLDFNLLNKLEQM